MFCKRNFIIMVISIMITWFITAPMNLWAQEIEEPPVGNDESGTFSPVAPDALMLLDLSKSMDWTPAGATMYVASLSSCWGSGVAHYSSSGPSHLKECLIDLYDANPDPYYSNTECTGPFYTSQQTGYATDCRRVAIAKNAIFDLLNADNEDASANVIDSADMDKLDVRIGYMRFRQTKSWDSTYGNDTGGDYTRGNIQLITELGKTGDLTGTSYSKTYCGSSTSCASTVSSCATAGECIAVAGTTSAPVRGGTPLVFALKEAKNYLDDHKAADTKANTCRQKFIVLISDGADTFNCTGDGTECDDHMYRRRRESVAAAKALADAGYRIFVIGLGDNMPPILKNTLNWMAYYGGTNNAHELDVGDTSAYSLPNRCNSNPAVPAECCVFDKDTSPFNAETPSACYPSGVTSSCQSDVSGTSADTTYCNATLTTFKAADGKDPGYEDLSGYAFIVADKSQLSVALQSALYSIGDMSYTFTQASIQAVRTQDENYMYEASFEPLNNESFWQGHLKRYSIMTGGAVFPIPDWDTGNVLVNTTAAQRTKIFTIINNSIELFTTDNTDITTAHLAVTTSTEKDAIINLVRGGKEIESGVFWKLGDIFHSSPVSVATPNPLFYDNADKSDPKAFDVFRIGTAPFYTDHHERTSENGKRIILVGANDGQLHAIKTGDNTDELPGEGGSEVWSFIPPNHLPRLKLLQEIVHRYYVDGPTTAGEIWVKEGAETEIGATEKYPAEWKTLLVTSLGRGGLASLWSSSPSCDSGFSADYDSTTYKYYCGYYAFDVTDTLNIPEYEWRIGGKTGALSADDGPYFGQPWSKMFIGRVRINNKEKWVGMIGGGYSGEQCAASSCKNKKGKGFFVVDLANGQVLWRYTNATDSTMRSDLAARPVAVDTDNDGFVDRAYIGDTGGHVWRFNFCKRDETTCSPTSTCVEGKNCWSGSKLFENPTISIRPIYTACAVTVDTHYNLWVYFGTGDKTDPTAPAAQERFYAIKDRGATYDPGDLVNLTNVAEILTYTDSDAGNGWFIGLTDQDKILAEPVIFEGRVYFTTYSPTVSSTNYCDNAGTSNLFILDYITAAGKLTNSEGDPTRSVEVGSGIATSPVISRNPEGGTSVYVSTSVAEDVTVAAGTVLPDGTILTDDTIVEGPHADEFEDPNMFDNPNSSVIYWQDRRIR